MYSAIVPKGIVRFRSCNKAVVKVFPHKAEPFCATRTGQYFLGRQYISMWWKGEKKVPCNMLTHYTDPPYTDTIQTHYTELLYRLTIQTYCTDPLYRPITLPHSPWSFSIDGASPPYSSGKSFLGTYW